MSVDTREQVQAYRYTTILPPYDGTGPIPSRVNYRIVRVADFPEDYIHGRLKPYYQSFKIHDGLVHQNSSFQQRNGVEIVYDLINNKFCWIDLSMIDDSTVVRFNTTMAINPIDVPLIEDLDT